MVLITGGMGFIGLQTAREFLGGDENVIITRFRTWRDPAIPGRTGFSLPVFVCASKFKTDRLKPALLEAVQPAVDSQESEIGQHCKNDQN